MKPTDHLEEPPLPARGGPCRGSQGEAAWARPLIALLLAGSLLPGCLGMVSGQLEADAGTHLAVEDAGPSSSTGPADASFEPDELPDGGWRSALFPKGWQPRHAGGEADLEGRYLPDFSYAGYHRGERRPPIGLGRTVAEVDPLKGDGLQDATASIQAAIDTACAAGGGVVQLPAGTFRLTLPSATAAQALLISCSKVVLRGGGPSTTRLLFDDAKRARSKSVITLRASGPSSTASYPLVEDAAAATRTVRLASTAGLEVGAQVTVRNDNTAAFRADHRMDEASSGLANLWPSEQFFGLSYHRRIVWIEAGQVGLDAPLHYPLRVRDQARLLVRGPLISEVGIEALAIGMVENRTTPGKTEQASDGDYEIAGTTGYEVHGSRAVTFDQVHDAWLHDVDSFLPTGNLTLAHLLSDGVLVRPGASRITIEGSDLGSPQYRGGGGNGYLFHLQGHDVLVADSSATSARHGLCLNQATAGNVFTRVTLRDSRYSEDTHRFLSHANLFDGVRLDRAWLQSVNRGTTSGGGGFTGTMLVFWNTQVLRNHPTAAGCAVESAQWGHGYLIGSSAAAGAQALLCPQSFSNGGWKLLDQGAPAETVEGAGEGQTLFPSSLHQAQRALRCAREGIACQ